MTECERLQFDELIQAVKDIQLVVPTIDPPDPVECVFPRRQRPKEKDKDYAAFIGMWLDIFDPL